jgi:putative heme-binding domain-containing protein
VRRNTPTGETLAVARFAAGAGDQAIERNSYQEVTVPLEGAQAVSGIQTLYLVATGPSASTDQPPAVLSLHTAYFHDSPTAATARKSRREKAQRWQEQQAELAGQTTTRPFVRNWTMEDLAGDLDQLDRGRSFENGQQLFKDASCAACHRMGGNGSRFGPDLTDVRRRLAEKPDPRIALLKEIVDPSAVIDPKFQIHVIATSDGRLVVGIIVAEDDETIQLSASPLQPANHSIRRSEIEHDDVTKTSLMPTGLLTTLTKQEILDLLAYLESGDDANRPALGN